MRFALPNLLTAARGLSGPAIFGLVLFGAHPQWAFTVFLCAVLTDLADGWVARQLQATSVFGSTLDPIADKSLVLWSWLSLWLVGAAPLWLAGGMMARDLVIAGWWLAKGRPELAKPNLIGQVKVSFEGVALPVLLFRQDWLGVHWPSVGLVLGMIALGLAVLSAASYLPRIWTPSTTDRRPGEGRVTPGPWRAPRSTRTSSP